jgi:hypothetical protein
MDLYDALADRVRAQIDALKKDERWVPDEIEVVWTNDPHRNSGRLPEASTTHSGISRMCTPRARTWAAAISLGVCRPRICLVQLTRIRSGVRKGDCRPEASVAPVIPLLARQLHGPIPGTCTRGVHIAEI